MTSVIASELDALMAEMPNWASEFSRTYANHAPMVLVALERLGAKPRQLQEFFCHYRDYKGLVPFGAQHDRLEPDTWASAIGQRDREPDLRAYFVREVEEHGVDASLAAHLPELAPFVGASALHALMRTAYALLGNNRSEIAIALAYWAATAFDMPASRGLAPLTDEPAEVLRRVAAIPSMHGLTLHELLWQNMAESGRQPGFAPVVDWLDIGPETPSRMAGTAIALFSATQDFCALHAVTGMHWMRVVLPYCPDPELLLRHFWACIAALMGEMRFPDMPDSATLDRWRSLPVPGWSQIRAAAAQSFDEHDISLVFSASEEMKVYGDPLYQLAAARRVGLVGDFAA